MLDVNLREPWWDEAFVCGLLDEAHWAKLNDREFDLLAPAGADTGPQEVVYRGNGIIISRVSSADSH